MKSLVKQWCRIPFILSLTMVFFTVSLQAQKAVKRNYRSFSDTAFSAGDILLSPEIWFEVSSCHILPQSKDSADIIADFIRKWPRFQVEIGVHTDVRGNAGSLVALSTCRRRSLSPLRSNTSRKHSRKVSRTTGKFG